VVPLLRWERHHFDGLYTSVRTCAGFRVYLRRPWHTTGVGERLGVLVFNAGNTPPTTAPAQRHVTHWGSDPLELGPSANSPHPFLRPDAFPAAKEVLPSVRLREFGDLDPASYGVTVVGHEVRFDAGRDLWYADVELKLPDVAFPFVRFGLVRFQPVSVPKCHVSSVVHADFARLLPTRTLTATRVDASSMQIAFAGPTMLRKASAQFHRRLAPDVTLPLGQPVQLAAGSGEQKHAGIPHLPPRRPARSTRWPAGQSGTTPGWPIRRPPRGPGSWSSGRRSRAGR
jgi:hypothetical protein